MNWDDLRIVATIRDEGTFAGAGAKLRIDETTIGRRLKRIERALGVRLFEAIDGLRKPTAQCERVLGHVHAMAGHVAEIARVGESLPGLSGRFRIAATNAVAEEILSPRVASLLTKHPGLSLQFLTSSENVKFSRWQADFAVRLNKPDRGDFTIAKLGELRLYLIEPAADGEAEAIVCAYPEDLGPIPETQFLKARGLQQHQRFLTGNVRVLRTLIESRQAIAVLPEFLCGESLADRRLRATLLPRHRDVWLLVQNHLKRDAAARVVIDFVRECFQDLARG
jgi:DNA-binding transcriptional LysR family regulator